MRGLYSEADLALFEEVELEAIRSASYELPGYVLNHQKIGNETRNLFSLSDRAGNFAAAMIIVSGGEPWIWIEAPFALGEALYECLLIKDRKTIGLTRDLANPNPFNGYEVDDRGDLNRLGRIWGELPLDLQSHLTERNTPPHRKLVRSTLCFIADAYQKIWEIEYPLASIPDLEPRLRIPSGPGIKGFFPMPPPQP